MRGAVQSLRDYLGEAWGAWNRFWFEPTDPATLCVMRLLAGMLLFYTHAIWSLELQGFIGADGYLPVAQWRATDPALPDAGPPWHDWSLFYLSMPTWLLWTVHLSALAIFAMLAAGLYSRVTSVLACLLAVSYAHRVTPGAYFGLDKINCMMALYLLLGPCGARYSLDSWRRRRRNEAGEPGPSISANIAVRLVQLHMCAVYLFSGLAKLGGETWQAGTAVWWAVANYEYQSLDLTWLAGWPLLVAILTHVTVFWELFYVCLVWNRLARPIVLWIAVAVHGGIAIALGMITFGFAMLIGNLSFIQPATVRRWIESVTRRRVVEQVANL